MTPASAPAFQWYDYMIFVSTLVVSTSVGIYFGCFGSKQTTNDYLMGHKRMKVLPVGLSLTVSHFSALTLISVPADTYKYGAYFFFASIPPVLVAVATIYIFLPVFFNLQITSIYEYLEKRFDRRTRLLGSFLYILFEITFGSFIVYTPSLAISAGTGINANVICMGSYLICLFYTAIGGLKTVIWTDLFQFIVIAGCLIFVFVVGLVANGGLIPVWNTATEGGRLDIFDFDLDPTRRDSFWIYCIGNTFMTISFISLSQAGMQKFLTLPSFRSCVWASIYSTISMCFVIIICVCIGLTMYAQYSQCDLILSKKISRHDQMTAYYILDVTKHIYGIAGLFFATLSCASLSSVSCSLNAMSGVIYKDFLSGFLRNVSDKRATNILKLIVVVCGLVCLCFVQLMQHAKELFPLALSLAGILFGPTLGMFTLGVIFPQANAKGAFFGTIGGFITVASIVFPKHYYQFRHAFIYPSKPLSTSGCDNFTLASNITIMADFEPPMVPFIFRISHYYNGLMGAVPTIILGLVISWMTKNKNEVDDMLLSPFVRRLIAKKSKKNEKVFESLMNETDG